MRVAAIIIGVLALGPMVHAAPNASAFAMRTMTPGRSIGPIRLGMTKTDVHALMGSPNNAHHVKGYEDEMWTMGQKKNLQVTYRQGRVVQIDLNRDPSILVTNFAKLTTNGHWNLKCRVYGMDDPEGSGFEAYYFDDIHRGVCFEASAQDDFIMDESLPETLIVHPAGKHALPIVDDIYGKRDNSPSSRPYRNAAEAAKGDQAEMKKMKR